MRCMISSSPFCRWINLDSKGLSNFARHTRCGKEGVYPDTLTTLNHYKTLQDYNEDKWLLTENLRKYFWTKSCFSIIIRHTGCCKGELWTLVQLLTIVSFKGKISFESQKISLLIKFCIVFICKLGIFSTKNWKESFYVPML